MAVAVPSRIGQVNLANATDAMFLKVFGGEVLAAYRENNVFAGLTLQRTISHGKSAQFPATGKTTAAYHVPGAEIDGQTIAGAEREIFIDDLLISDVFIPQIDEAKNHFEYRSEYAYQLGAALARTNDSNIGQVIALAARAATTVTGLSGGTGLVDADALTSGASMRATAFDAAQALDEKDVPAEDRVLALSPAGYYELVQNGNVLDKDITQGVNGGVNTGRVFSVAGFDIVPTNNMPSANVATGPTAYQGNFLTTLALFFHRGVAGTVSLMGLATEMGWDMRRQGTLILAKQALGSGILRPECAVEITSV